ncbi:MAG: DNA repair protein RecO [Oscillospiraceae bacterium]|nr:DNA repair protein RecO [Oscillospiraceae bacterium]
MEKFTVDGIVIKTSVTGESDIIVFVLTRSRGIIRAFAKGARGTKSRLHAGCSLFAYCSFSFYEKNGVYNVTEAEIKEIFFELRSDMARLALAQYFCEILLKTLEEGETDSEYLRLTLGALYYLCAGKKDILLIKSVFEMRIASVSGYAPPVHACAECGEFSSENMMFNCLTGELFCESCGDPAILPSVPFSVIAAIRHIVFSEPEKVFAFTLKEELTPVLSRLTEKYLQNCFQQKFNLLEFFRTVYS